MEMAETQKLANLAEVHLARESQRGCGAAGRAVPRQRRTSMPGCNWPNAG